MNPASPQSKHATTTRPAQPRCHRPAFSLVEMIVVVGIIIVILGITLPAVRGIWEQRKLSEAQNVIQGLLMTTRGRALQPDAVDTGLFFFVDGDGVQRIVSIAQPKAGDLVWQNVFRITDDRDFSLPAPIRVVPRYVVDPEQPGETEKAFSPVELVNNDFENPPMGTDGVQRHRNFFTIIFSSDGSLRVGRDVLIQDPDGNEPPDGLGDVTGLAVGVDTTTPDVPRYMKQDNSDDPIDPLGGNATVPMLLTNVDGNAINLPGVDGLLVYDDSLFQEAGQGAAAATQKHDYLLNSAQPFYINRLTGGIIRGPVGESVVP